MVSFNVMLSLAIMEDVFVFIVFFSVCLYWLFKLQFIFQTAISLVEPHGVIKVLMSKKNRLTNNAKSSPSFLLCMIGSLSSYNACYNENVSLK